MNKFLLVTIYFLIGILLFYMLKNHCDCKVVEGQGVDKVNNVIKSNRTTWKTQRLKEYADESN